jgi:N-acetylneuraminic acid mutarotase
MKTNNKVRGYIIRRAAYAALFLCIVAGFASAFNVPNKWSALSRSVLPGSALKRATQTRTLTFADRVAYQRAIEEVYWQHRIWPKENGSPKPPLDKVMSQAQIEKKVEDYLRNSQALEDYWQRPITPDQLQAEMERMASHTKQPEVLREIFAALGNDPLVIAECLARPVLAERSLTELYAHDQRFHGDLKQRAEAELKTHRSVRQMKRTSGMYTEMEWIKSDSAKDDSASADTKSAQAVKMNGSEWQESVERLAKDFGNAKTKDAWRQIKTGVLSPLQEDEGHYYAVAVMKKGKDRLRLATVAWLKEPLRSWLRKAEAQVPVTMAAVSANYTLPSGPTPSDPCTDNSWTATSTTSAPDGRIYFTAVWTGSEMIVWGGNNGPILNTGGRYNPSTDSWTATSTTNAPDARNHHTAVWTGTEMIVWGGNDCCTFFYTGGRYDPGADSWAATSTTDVPDPRIYHTAVWTGSQMIVWGGYNGSNVINTGAQYDPSTDSWAATSTTNAPAVRDNHTAVWTGSEMIVWGGDGSSGFVVNTGGRYDPGSDSWTATSTTNVPNSRASHTAVWTGSQMIVWGGFNNLSGGSNLNTGARYNPSTDSWTATSTTNAPAGRESHTAVWTDSQMIVWGGIHFELGNTYDFNTGGRYNPSTDSWTATSTTGAPDARDSHAAVWTGNQMIVWGGYNGSELNTGGRYCAATPTTQVTVQTSPAGLTFNVDGTDYSVAQTFTWPTGSPHTIATTTPQSGDPGVRYYFSSWSDGGAISHTVAPTKNTTYTAKFGTQYYLTMNAGLGGTVSPPNSWRTSGTTVSVTATPTNNSSVSYSFSGWTGSGTGSYSGTNNPASITMNGPITETAAFTQNPVQITVQTSPTGLSFTVDGTTYTAAQAFSWAPGSSHIIATTTPQSGATGVRYTWSKWSDNGAISHSVAPTTNKTYTATFGTQYYLTMNAGAGGKVSPGSSWRSSGTTVSITATPATGHTFSSWTGSGTGSYSGTNNPASITMSGPITETAAFTP